MGAGQMGAGIAQVAATAGLAPRVVVVDPSPAARERGAAQVASSLERLVKKGTVAEATARAAAAALSWEPDVAALRGANLVVEAAPEDEALKRDVFARLDGVVPEDAVLASNTSSISLTRIAAATRNPGRVLGMHFMNPPPLMALVEVIRARQTTDAAFDRALALCDAMGKTVCVSADRPGFIVNRVLMPMINEAFYTLMEGVATREDIDAGMKLGTNQPMGPLTLADFIGLDTCLAIMRVLHAGLGDSKYRPCPLLVEYVDAGYLGRKAKKGVYDY